MLSIIFFTEDVPHQKIGSQYLARSRKVRSSYTLLVSAKVHPSIHSASCSGNKNKSKHRQPPRKQKPSTVGRSIGAAAHQCETNDTRLVFLIAERWCLRSFSLHAPNVYGSIVDVFMGCVVAVGPGRLGDGRR